ncbi:MAG: DUF3108 domain-containing protein [Fibrobacterales bacterium]
MKYLLLFIFLISTSLFSQKKILLPFHVGEKITYEINYGFITAGNATMEVLQDPQDSTGLIFKALAWNNGFFEAVYPVQDTILTQARKSDLIPSTFKKINNEGSWHNHVHIQQDLESLSAHLADTVFDKDDNLLTVKRYTDTVVTLDTLSHTITSAFYLFRTLDLEPGNEYKFNAISGKKEYKLKVIAHRYETVEVEAGEFDCIVVEPILDEDGLFEAKGKLTIWLTNDDKKIPVLVKSKILVGSIAVEMTKYSKE